MRRESENGRTKWHLDSQVPSGEAAAGPYARELGSACIGENPQKILRIKTIANRVGAIAERGLEARDRVSAALGVRIVGREKIQLRIRLIDQSADVFEDIRRECHLLSEWFGRLAREAGKVRVSLAPNLRGPIEANQHRRHPSGTDLDASAAQFRKALEHALDQHHREKRLGHLIKHRHVFGAEILATAHPIFDRRPAVVGPRVVELQRRTADMQYERSIRLYELRP